MTAGGGSPLYVSPTVAGLVAGLVPTMWSPWYLWPITIPMSAVLVPVCVAGFWAWVGTWALRDWLASAIEHCSQSLSRMVRP